MTDAPDLPFHFAWRYGLETHTLASALTAIDADGQAAAFHLREGHLQRALADQGYGVLAEGLGGDEAAPLLRERIRIALELHRAWWSERDAGDDLGKAMNNLGRILRGKGKDLLAESKRHLTGFRTWLADAIRNR